MKLPSTVELGHLGMRPTSTGRTIFPLYRWYRVCQVAIGAKLGSTIEEPVDIRIRNQTRELRQPTRKAAPELTFCHPEM